MIGVLRFLELYGSMDRFHRLYQRKSYCSKVVAFTRNADLLIHDAQYTPEELKDKKGWGHSSWEQAIEVAVQAGVKKLALFHHDPEHNDAFLLNIERECQRVFSEAFLAREGLEIEI